MKVVFKFILLIILFYLLFMKINMDKSLEQANKNLEKYEPKIANLSYGKMEYLDKGEGEIILSNHGLFGGFDQGYENIANLSNNLRIIAPSRFGYLNSDIKGDGTPKEQAKAYVELLDYLNIDKVFIMGASAGGTLAIRFALDYPERCKGLILYSSAMPEKSKVEKVNYKQGPPDVLVNNYPMYLLSPLFNKFMGMDKDIIKSMLPIDKKIIGIKLDSEVNNPDMAANFDDYNIESLKAPVLIMQAEDDKLTDVNKMVNVSSRFPNLTMKIFKSGGHMLRGNDAEVRKTVNVFIENFNCQIKLDNFDTCSKRTSIGVL